MVTVMNMKGGVGKTTVSMHVAGAMARYRFKGLESFKKILMIDYDPQFNLSQSYIASKVYFELEKNRKTTLSILVDDDSDLDPYEIQVPGNHTPPSVKELRTELLATVDGGCLHIVPSTLDLMYLALGRAKQQIEPIEERFSKFIAECRSEYDLVIIDCHPAGSIFTKTSLKNSDAVLIPVVPERFAARGLGLMLKFIEAKKAGVAGPVPCVLFNRTNRNGLPSRLETSIRTNHAFGKYCLNNTLKKYGAFAEPEEGKGFVWSSKKPYSGEARSNILNVTEEFLNGIK
ncbi:ParA family protein [Burkholderia ubonensis]|uniref:ParA family protein n=1 Tax=Burkholderia ubonensis TaxID=101571 RepID=UPI0022B75BC2|nr:ParA family protein [Burkholderia ubonensis]